MNFTKSSIHHWMAKTFIALSIFSLGQISQAKQFDYWMGLFPHYQIDEKQKLSMQSEFRRIEQNSLGLFRPAYHYKLTSTVSLGLGYDIFIQKRNEQRLWPELNGRHSFIGQDIFLDWRARHEFRFLENETSTGERTRFMLGLQLPMSEAPFKTSLYLFNEAFLNHKTLTGVQKQEWDRNWLGFRARLHKKFTYDLGLFWEHIFQRNEDNFVTTLSIGLKF